MGLKSVVAGHDSTKSHIRYEDGKEMKITYDPEVDTLRVIFSTMHTEESDEEKLGMILDYDIDGNIVGLEILDASKRMENPRSVEYAVA
jgi:uncharacterized protein YuzE